MFGSAALYSGLILAAAGVLLTGAGLLMPAHESRIARAESQLDRVMPVWQFNEVHTLHIDAPPAVVYEAVRNVRADEIRLFGMLTWIRRGGRSLPEGILNARSRRPLLDIATGTSFVWLANDAPRELVVGTAVISPRGADKHISAEAFVQPLPPGYALGAMNFVVLPEGNGSRVTTETRVYANSSRAKRRFTAYWRIIYPGSALIRRMWLRAVERRALAAM
jgi:hypothetical protein